MEDDWFKEIEKKVKEDKIVEIKMIGESGCSMSCYHIKMAQIFNSQKQIRGK